MKIAIYAGSGLAILLAGFPVTAQQAEKPLSAALQAEIDAVNAAADTNNGPPVAQAIFAPAPKAFQKLGVIGPYWPDRAARSGVNGYAVLQCASGPSGVLNACKALAEVPTDWGFEDAGLRMAAQRYLTIAPSPQRPEGAPVRVVVEYKLPR